MYVCATFVFIAHPEACVSIIYTLSTHMRDGSNTMLLLLLLLLMVLVMMMTKERTAAAVTVVVDAGIAKVIYEGHQ